MKTKASPLPDQAGALSRSGPDALEIYPLLLKTIRQIGPFEEVVKKTSIHLVRGSAFLAFIREKRRC